MRAWFDALARPVQVMVVAVVAVVGIGLLLLFYDWLGGALLDTGGSVG